MKRLSKRHLKADSYAKVPILFKVPDQELLEYINGTPYKEKIETGEMTNEDWTAVVKDTAAWLMRVGREKASQSYPAEGEYQIDEEQIQKVKNMFQNLPRQSKKAYPEDKWQSQKEVVPIGLGERGWQAYEPFKQSDNSASSIADRAKALFEELKDKRKVLKQLETEYPDTSAPQLYSIVESVTKESDFGFFDGPSDLGKRPKGDFPSVQWMPRGNEDEDVRDDDYLTRGYLKLYNYFKPKIKKQKVAFGVKLAIKPEKLTFWYEDKEGNVILDASDGEALKEPYEIQEKTKGAYQNSIMPLVIHSITTENDGQVMRFETSINCIEPIVLHLCNKQEWKLTDAIVAVANTCERCLNILLEQTTGEKYTERDTCNTSCAHCAEIDPEYAKKLEASHVSLNPKLAEAAVVQWLKKQADENELLDEFEREIAAKYGPEYNSALMHFNEAKKHGHPEDRALEYAIAEMVKVDMPIKPEILLEVIETYAK